MVTSPAPSTGAVPGEGGRPLPAGDLAQRESVYGGTGLPAAGVMDELSNVLATARAAFSNFLDLISLEARRAGLALMWMMAWGLVAAICIVVAWLGLMAALAMCAVALGFSPIAAVIVTALINLLAGVMLINVCMRISRDLLFSATRRQVCGECSAKPSSS